MSLFDSKVGVCVQIDKIAITDPHRLKEFGISKNSFITVVKKVNPIGLIVGYNHQRFAIDTKTAKNIIVKG
jgi:Fe2+ transport system protein FeoA